MSKGTLSTAEYLSLVILVHQIVVLADNLEAGFLFPCNVQPVTGYPGTLDDKPILRTFVLEKTQEVSSAKPNTTDGS